jgi:CubicO group peptidase (beta-lactamase class C family)
MSIGVLHESLTVHTASYGGRDCEVRLAPDSDTLYWAGSLSKSMIAIAIGMLIEDKSLSWDSIVSSILPDFEHQSVDVEQKSRANFAPEFKLPLSKLTATDNIML